MIVGAMNHPNRDLFEEIAWMADMGLGFLDLTLEPPCSPSWKVDPGRVRQELESRKMAVVGHTAYYLPIGSPFEDVRKGAVAELKRCIRIFAQVGAKWMNVHPDSYAPFHPREFSIGRNIESLREMAEEADRCGIGLMIENLPGNFNSPTQLGDLLDKMPELGLHLDIGHANLRGERNSTDAILAAYGARLRHVHLHDNKGGRDDLHLPLGAGTVDLAEQVRLLKKCGYDGAITLEVFAEDRHYLDYSRSLLLAAWAA